MEKPLKLTVEKREVRGGFEVTVTNESGGAAPIHKESAFGSTLKKAGQQAGKIVQEMIERT